MVPVLKMYSVVRLLTSRFAVESVEKRPCRELIIGARIVPPTSNAVWGVDRKIPTDVEVRTIVGVELEEVKGKRR